MKPKSGFRARWMVVLLLGGFALLVTTDMAFSQAAPGAAGGGGRGGGGREYGGGPARLVESRELPPSIKKFSDHLCDSGTLERSYFAGIFHYQCLSSSPALTMRPGSPTPRAKIGADCEEEEGSPKNCVWNCTADEDSNCAAFITNCVEQDGDVQGNKSGATCSFP